MHQLGPIDLVDFGLIPSVVDNSTNLALSGCWDFPARLGKSFQDWNDDQNGVEPYVREEEIRLAGRDITFVALLSAESENAALLKCYELYKLVGGLNSLVPFTTDLGTFNVYLKDQVIADYIGDGWCKLKFTFREPILNYSGVIPAASNAELGIDGIAFKDLGLTVLDVTGRWNRPAPKNFKATFYENEGYKVSTLQNREVTIKALLSGANYTEFIGHLNGLYLLFKKEGLRYITYENDMYRSFFVKDGFQVSNVLQAGNGETTGVLTCKFTEVTASSDWSFLMTSTGSELTDKLGQKIIVVPPVSSANLDFTLTVETTLPNSVPNAGGTYELQIASNAEFFVLESHSFLSLSDSAGQNSGTITVNVEANVSTARTGTITVLAGDKLEIITVAQGAGAVVNTLAVDVSTVSNAATGGNTTITVTSNVAWTVSSNMGFVTANKTGAFGNSTFVLTVAPNTTAFVRTAIVTIAGGGITRNISVQQSATAEVSTNSALSILKTIPVVANGVSTLDLTPYIVGTNVPTYTDSDGIIRPTWGVWWSAGNIFQTVLPWKVSLTGADKYIEHFGGFATGDIGRGKGYILGYDPETGQSVAVDPYTITEQYPNGRTPAQFESTIPYWNRVEAQLQTTVRPFDTVLDWYYGGRNYGQDEPLGNADNVTINGVSKSRRSFVTVDFEFFEYTAEEQVAFLLGMYAGTVARKTDRYLPPFNWVGKSLNYTNNGLEGQMTFLYPDDPDYLSTDKIDRTNVWNYSNPTRITLNSVGIVNKSALDTDCCPAAEVSTSEAWFYPQGSTQSRNGETYIVNKFGLYSDWTETNPIMHAGLLLQTWSYYTRTHLNRTFVAMTKIISDKGNWNTGKLCNRKYAFLFGILTYMNACDWDIWGEYMNLSTSIDGYNGVFAFLKLVRDSGGMADFQNMNPDWWNTEYSLDAGATWKTTKALDWADSTTDVLPVLSKRSSTHIEFAALRGEGIEPTSFKVRFVVNNQTIIKTISPSDWETTSYDYRNAALADIPNEHKDFYYKRFAI